MNIEPQPEIIPYEKPLSWLAEKNNHGLDESGLSDLIRLLIASNNDLEKRVVHLERRVEQLDRLVQY